MKLLREPLLHFLLIGAVLFGAFQLTRSGDGETAQGEIVVSAGQIASMEAIFSRTWQRPPTAAESQALVNDYVRDEVFYREALAMGLDRDDAVIRRRMRQKMEFISDLAADAEPTDVELKAFVAEHPARFRSEPRFSFSHVYFSTGLPVAELDSLRQALNGGAADASKVGSPFLPGFDFTHVARSDVAQTFGESFATWIGRARPGEWGGPVASAYGTHLVRVSERIEARELPFAEVREVARRELLHGRKITANDALYARLRARYVISVEGSKLAEAAQ
ncbi:peptidyl-prolyl cis-trans isomerase [Taklimakanibacter deserti]|uniref:peptidylprolyl isomerase n=1 Tax=Taklimakanibacter deserti TaxID=2267839 RepID=UPI0013C4876C